MHPTDAYRVAIRFLESGRTDESCAGFLYWLTGIMWPPKVIAQVDREISDLRTMAATNAKVSP